MNAQERLAMRARLEAACCDFHGFGPNSLGRRQFAEHVNGIARTVERFKDRYSTEATAPSIRSSAVASNGGDVR